MISMICHGIKRARPYQPMAMTGQTDMIAFERQIFRKFSSSGVLAQECHARRDVDIELRR